MFISISTQLLKTQLLKIRSGRYNLNLKDNIIQCYGKTGKKYNFESRNAHNNTRLRQSVRLLNCYISGLSPWKICNLCFEMSNIF